MIDVGTVLTSERFGTYEILEVLVGGKVRIKFTSTGFEYVCYKSQAKNSQVKDLMHPTVCDVGFVGGNKYSYSQDVSAYDTWCNMLKHCYNKRRLEIRPSYSGCTVADEWHNFQNFAEWYYTNKLSVPCHLDKDLLSKGNTIYSPDVCCFLPTEINVALLGGKKYGKSCGVFWRDKDEIFVAQINRNKRLEYLGCFKDEVHASNTYIRAKKEWLSSLAEKYEDVLLVKAYEALHNWQPT